VDFFDFPSDNVEVDIIRRDLFKEDEVDAEVDVEGRLTFVEPERDSLTSDSSSEKSSFIKELIVPRRLVFNASGEGEFVIFKFLGGV
jgi:hypothetical protein